MLLQAMFDLVPSCLMLCIMQDAADRWSDDANTIVPLCQQPCSCPFWCKQGSLCWSWWSRGAGPSDGPKRNRRPNTAVFGSEWRVWSNIYV